MLQSRIIVGNRMDTECIQMGGSKDNEVKCTRQPFWNKPYKHSHFGTKLTSTTILEQSVQASHFGTKRTSITILEQSVQAQPFGTNRTSTTILEQSVQAQPFWYKVYKHNHFGTSHRRTFRNKMYKRTTTAQ